LDKCAEREGSGIADDIAKNIRVQFLETKEFQKKGDLAWSLSQLLQLDLPEMRSSSGGRVLHMSIWTSP
jgi:hypothetical protein